MKAKYTLGKIEVPMMKISVDHFRAVMDDNRRLKEANEELQAIIATLQKEAA